MTHHEQQHRARTGRPVEDRIDRVLGTADRIGGEDEQRREILVERAEARGLARPAAEQAYDIAREEALQPSYGLALVLEGLSIQPVASPRPAVGTTEPNEPEWVDTPPDPKMAERERRLRQTFRRLRAHLDEAGGREAAVRAFGQEPDLERYEY